VILGRVLILFQVLGLAALVVFGLHHAAQERIIGDLTEQLHSSDRSAAEHAASTLIIREMQHALPRPGVVVQAWGLLRGHPQGAVARTVIEGRIESDLSIILRTADPDHEHLHRLWELAAIIDAELASAVHVRIAARAGDRSTVAGQLVRAAQVLEAYPLTADPLPLGTAWRQLRDAGNGRGWFTWAAFETPPLTQAIESAERALTSALKARLESTGTEKNARASDPRSLESVWSVLRELELLPHVHPTLIAQYAQQTRIQDLPALALIVCGAISTLLFGGLAWAFQRLNRRRRAIDQGAETLENVDPIDYETDVVTLQRDVTSEETRVD